MKQYKHYIFALFLALLLNFSVVAASEITGTLSTNPDANTTNMTSTTTLDPNQTEATPGTNNAIAGTVIGGTTVADEFNTDQTAALIESTSMSTWAWIIIGLLLLGVIAYYAFYRRPSIR